MQNKLNTFEVHWCEKIPIIFCNIDSIIEYSNQPIIVSSRITFILYIILLLPRTVNASTDTIFIPSPNFHQVRKVYIKTPNDKKYASDKVKYPVLYLLDAQQECEPSSGGRGVAAIGCPAPGASERRADHKGLLDAASERGRFGHGGR